MNERMNEWKYFSQSVIKPNKTQYFWILDTLNKAVFIQKLLIDLSLHCILPHFYSCQTSVFEIIPNGP